jgi:arylsulfatase A-like enzyme
MTTSRPNVLMIALDSLRADHMSLFGYTRRTTPHIDQFARGGVVFEDAFSPHIPTTSAFANLLTGRDCFGTGIVSLRDGGPIRARTLAQVLAAEGYATSCVGFTASPVTQGFETCLDYAAWGSWAERPLAKAERLAEVAVPELRRLASCGRPFFLMLRYMDAHSPYLPPPPYDRMFYGGNECDPANRSMEPVLAFKPFRDYFALWMPPGVTDKDYVVAQYDGAVAYMDACVGSILALADALGLGRNTLFVLFADHGESLDEHDCYFDHHGLYECILRVALVFRMPGRLPARLRLRGNCLLQDVTPTVLDVLGISAGAALEGQSLLPHMEGGRRLPSAEFYITECTWMRKHGWRTPEWKLIHALEPDFHFKPEVELYNLIKDPLESVNLAAQEPEVAACLERRMAEWIARREHEAEVANPMWADLRSHGLQAGQGAFLSSQQAYDALRVNPMRLGQAVRTLFERMRALGYA